VSAVAQADHCNPGLRCFGGTKLAGELTDDLAEAAIAIDNGNRIRFENDSRRLARFHPSVAHPLEILADAE
jgi:hypothetical protein